jgi:hypothetical protein
MKARTAQEWIDILQKTYADKMDEPLMLDWIDRHHAEMTLGRVVSKARFKTIVDKTSKWFDDYPSTTCLHETLKEAAECS